MTNKKGWAGITVIAMLLFSSGVPAAAPGADESETLIGQWDHHSGVIGFFAREEAGAKRVRMQVTDEHPDSKLSGLLIDMSVAELDDLEDMLDIASDALDNANKLPIPPAGSRETVRKVGRLVYPAGTLQFSVVTPADTPRYVEAIMQTPDKRNNYRFWMEREDLNNLKKLLDKSLDAVGGDPSKEKDQQKHSG
jgi:hypothetical protein